MHLREEEVPLDEGAGVLLDTFGFLRYTFQIKFCTFKLNNRRMYDIKALFTRFVDAKNIALQENVPLVIVIEDQHRWPKLMMGFGVIWALAWLCSDKVVLVAPRTWQRSFGIKKADKKVSIDLANGLLGLETNDHNVAEAALIALYQYNKEVAAHEQKDKT